MWAMLFLGALLSKNAVMGTSNAAAICCRVLTLGEVLPFSIRLKVLTFKPLRSASARMERSRSFRSSRNRRPTLTSELVDERALGAGFGLAARVRGLVRAGLRGMLNLPMGSI